jgi:hypothetical protein
MVKLLKWYAVNMNLIDFQWSPDGKSLVMMDKDKFTLAFPIDELAI